jgi:hypothetical protein
MGGVFETTDATIKILHYDKRRKPRMAQARRMGMQNGREQLTNAPRLSPIMRNRLTHPTRLTGKLLTRGFNQLRIGD